MVNTMHKFFYSKLVLAGVPAIMVPSWSAPVDS